MKPPLQERFHIYVFGPNQDSRLASVAAGLTIEKLQFRLDTDAPFLMRGRAVRQSYTSLLRQAQLPGLKTRWSGPAVNYRQQDFTLESLQSANYGQGGNPQPIYPGVFYPANGVITLDLQNTGLVAIPNLTFYFIGVKLYPWGTVPGYTYPPKFGSLAFQYPIPPLVQPLAVTDYRQNQVFNVRPDADFVIRGGQAGPVTTNGATNTVAEIFFQLKDFNKKPYSNDLVHIDVLFGCGGMPSTIPIGPTPDYLTEWGPGPARPGIFYPEIYVPKNHQMFYDVSRADAAIGGTAAAEVRFNWVGAKVFE